MSVPTVKELAQAVRDAGTHSHRDLGHGQTGNPFFPWWHQARWNCDLCLLVLLAEEGEFGLLFEFTTALPLAINRSYVGDSEAWWWKAAYLKVLRHLSDPEDRWEAREALAWALRRGREEREAKLASLDGDWELATR